MDEQRLPIRSGRRANVIWIFGDQHRGQAIGYRGDPNLRTPNIDNLARNGMRFDNAVAGAPWCTPFRAALLTGQYPHQVDVPQTPSALSPDLPTVAHAFNDAGYHTSWTGKWHLDGSNSDDHYVPPNRRGGFARWMGFENSNNQNETWIYGSDGEEPVRLEGYVTDSLTDRFISHLEEHLAKSRDRDYQPFFSVLSVQPPHSPYVPPDHYAVAVDFFCDKN